MSTTKITDNEIATNRVKGKSSPLSGSVADNQEVFDKLPVLIAGKVNEIIDDIDDCVVKVEGKGLSTEDYSTVEKTKLSGIEAGAEVNTITSVAGKTGNVVLTKADVGLENVDDTPDVEKPIPNSTMAVLKNIKTNTVTDENTISISDNNDKLEINKLNVFGNSIQNETPSPSSAADIISVQNPVIEIGSTSATLTGYTLRSARNYNGTTVQDKIYASGGKLYFEKNINIINSWSYQCGVYSKGTNILIAVLSVSDMITGNNMPTLCTHIVSSNVSNVWNGTSIGISTYNDRILVMCFPSGLFTTSAEFNEWANTNGLVVFYQLSTPVTTEITGEAATTLLTALSSIGTEFSVSVSDTNSSIIKVEIEYNQNLNSTFENINSDINTFKTEIQGDVDTLSENINNVQDNISELTDIKYPLNKLNTADSDYAAGKYISASGVLAENAQYNTSGYIEVKENDVVKFVYTNSGTAMFGAVRFSLMFDSNKNALPATFATSVNSMTALQDGFVRITYYSYMSKPMIVINQSEVPDYESYYAPYKIINNSMIQYDDTLSVENRVPDSKVVGDKFDEINSKLLNTTIAGSYSGCDGALTTCSYLMPNTSIAMLSFPFHLKKGITTTFSCEFTEFSSVLIGRGYNQYRGSWVEINNTNIVLHFYQTEDMAQVTVSHGLTISTFLKVSIYLDDSAMVHISINTLSGTFNLNRQWINEQNYTTFAKCSTALTNVKLSAVSKDFRKPMWLFGDSYCGVASNRVIGQLANLGYANGILINGIAGQSSIGGLADFKRCLEFSTPKYLIWCLGMNDTNQNYSTVLSELKTLCAQKNITLILTKIPSIPSKERETINSLIDSSELRYIDWYHAVGASVGGTWYSGYLENITTPVHPTELGAKSLAMQIVTDVPEITEYGYSQGNISDEISGDL